MLEQWADWFCDSSERRNPLVSPLRADLRGLPPIYVQAGRVEILYDSIQEFADHAQKQGSDVVLESWEGMNHVFQMFGSDSPQSVEALQRIGQVVDITVRGHKDLETVRS
jgi:acetyl esterase/lipase